MKKIFDFLNIRILTENIIEEYFRKACEMLDNINVPEDRKTGLKEFMEDIIKREK